MFMKNLFVFLTLSILLITVQAQRNYNGYYSTPNAEDKLVNTALTNFVNDKMLIIDTYQNYSYYLKLTFISDLLNPVNASIRYYSENEKISINDVKYDAVNDCYIACGWEEGRYLNGKHGIIMKFDNSGNVVWRTSAWNNVDGANEYRRLEIANSYNGFYYVSCGWGKDSVENSSYHGIVGFYDINGNLLNMFKPDNSLNKYFNSKYLDLVFKADSSKIDKIAIVGSIYTKDSNNIATGMIREEFSITNNGVWPGEIFTRNDSLLETTSITIDDQFVNYYVSGTLGKDNIYVAQIPTNNFGISIEKYFNNFGYTNLKVNDICYNRFVNNKSYDESSQLGIIGVCDSICKGDSLVKYHYKKQAFLFEVNTLNLSRISDGWSVWSGFHNVNIPPFYETYFDHITYRDNKSQMNGSSINYSYILYGGSDRKNISYIAEYYPYANICQELFKKYADSLIYLSDKHYVPDSLFSRNNLPHLLGENMENMLEYLCDPLPHYNDSVKSIKYESNTYNRECNYIYKDKIFYLDLQLTNSVCNIYSIDGKLLFSKQKGISQISTDNFKPGIYILQPIDNKQLKNIKFAILQ